MKRFALFPLVFISLACGDASPTNSSTNANRVYTNAMATPAASNSNAVPVNSSSNSVTTSNSQANSTKSNSTIRPPLPKPPSPSPPTVVAGQKEEEGLFSFPPPKVTSFASLRSESLLNPAGPTTFDFVSQKIAGMLENAGYGPEKYAYFWNDRDEFAIVTAVERIEEDGSPLSGSDRWNGSTNLPRAHRFDEYFRYLFGGKIVYYRVMAFVVTSKRYGRSFQRNSPPDFAMALNWMNKGEPQLGEGDGSAAIEAVPFDGRYRCYALLYLFVNHTSLDGPKSVDSLTGAEMGLEEGLEKRAEAHLASTHLNFGGTRNEP